jgi:predicted transcriptional regulator
VPTRQTSSSGKPKSPRIQVVLPEELCARLAALAEGESRTVSNMAKVLIQQGVERFERQRSSASAQAPDPAGPAAAADRFRRELEQQEQGGTRRLRGAPRRLRLRQPPSAS